MILLWIIRNENVGFMRPPINLDLKLGYDEPWCFSKRIYTEEGVPEKEQWDTPQRQSQTQLFIINSMNLRAYLKTRQTS